VACQEDYSTLLFFRRAQMRQAHRVILDQLAQAGFGSTMKLTELAQQPAESVERPSQYALAFVFIRVGKCQLQIRLAGASKVAANSVGNGAERSTHTNGCGARENAQGAEDRTSHSVFK
jgi:hypothetical protein